VSRLSYLGPGVAGPKARDAGIVCDVCGYFLRVGKYSLPPLWFLDGEAPPGWQRVDAIGETDEVERRDYCPRCKAGKGE
jgi:hypothetical protein